MTAEPPPPADDEKSEKPESAIDRALKALLVDDVSVVIDPATGDVASVDGQSASLTEDLDANTIG